MKKILLISLLAIGIKSSAQTVIFEQDFEASNSINYYNNANNPNIGQFSGFNNGLLVTNQTAAVISILDNKLNFDNTAAGSIEAYITRSSNFSVIPLVMKMECDVEVTKVTETTNLAFTFEVGQNFPYTYNSSIASDDIHSRLALRFTAPTTGQPDDDIFYIRRTKPNGNSANSYKGKQRITWVVNNSGADFTYTAPDGTEKTVVNDEHDIWVGTALVFGNLVAGKTAPDLKNIRITISGKANVALDNIKITSLKDTPLPVSFSSFTAKATAQNVLLNWETASEQNNKEFAVLRSADGKNFTAIATVEGKGTTNQPSHYKFVDESPFAGVNYYQLQQTDLNGTTENLKTITVNFGVQATELTVNATENKVKVSYTSQKQEEVKVQLFNFSGQKIAEQNIYTTNGNNNIDFNIALAPGFYFVHLVSEDNIITEKFVK